MANHAIYFHKLGTPQSQDRLLYATPDQPALLHLFDVSADGRYAVIISTPGSMNNSLAVVDLTSTDWTPRTLIDDLDHEWGFIGNSGSTLFLTTTKDAERRMIVSVDIAAAKP